MQRKAGLPIIVVIFVLLDDYRVFLYQRTYEHIKIVIIIF